MSPWKFLLLAVLCLDSVFSQSDSNLDNDTLWAAVSSSYVELMTNDYYFVGESKTWFEAAQYCASQGSHLAIMNSQEEAKIVGTYLAEHYNGVTYFFIGAHDLFSEGKFLTINCQSLQEAGYEVWYFDNPNGYVGDSKEDCVAMESNGNLNDIACSDKYYFICEHVPK